MIISLRCKICRDGLTGNIYEHLFFCNNCKKIYILREEKLEEIVSYIIDNEMDYNVLFPMFLFKCRVEYINFATARQKDVAIKCGNTIEVAVRAFSMIDPVYFGDIEIEIMQKINNSHIQLKRYTPEEKIFSMNINPEIGSRLSRYTFMKYFDRMTDITGMQYSFSIESSSILFLRGKMEDSKIILSDLKREIPLSAIITL